MIRGAAFDFMKQLGEKLASGALQEKDLYKERDSMMEKLGLAVPKSSKSGLKKTAAAPAKRGPPLTLKRPAASPSSTATAKRPATKDDAPKKETVDKKPQACTSYETEKSDVFEGLPDPAQVARSIGPGEANSFFRSDLADEHFLFG